MAIPIPPWLRGTEAAGNYTKGVALGTDIAEQANRMRVASAQLQQSAQEMAQRERLTMMELQVKQEQFEREALRREHELELEAAYREASIGLERSRVQQGQAALDLKAQELARQFAAEDEYQKMIAGGMSPAEAMMRQAPGLGITGVGLGSLADAMKPQAQIPEPVIRSMQTPSGRNVDVMETWDRLGGRHTQFVPREGSTNEDRQEQILLQGQLAEDRKQIEQLGYDESFLRRIIGQSQTKKGYEIPEQARSAVEKYQEILERMEKKQRRLEALGEETEAWRGVGNTATNTETNMPGWLKSSKGINYRRIVR